MTASNSISASLIEVARRLTQKMAVKVNQKNLPRAINTSTSVSPVTNSGNTYSISVKIDLSENGAPMAAAFEYGSGLHRTVGVPDTYTIAPKNAKALAFPFTITFMPGGKFLGAVVNGTFYNRKRVFNMMVNDPAGMFSSDKMIWAYVDHPGVEPRPYIQPSIIENRVEAKQLLTKGFIESLIVRGTTKYEVRVM
jgi:hypothetical protein